MQQELNVPACPRKGGGLGFWKTLIGVMLDE